MFIRSVYSRFTCSTNCQIWLIHIPNLFPFSMTCYPLSPFFARFFPVCLPFSYVFIMFAPMFSMFPTFSSMFIHFRSNFQHFSLSQPFPAAFSHHLSTIFLPFFSIPSLSTGCFPHRPGLHTLPARPAAR